MSPVLPSGWSFLPLGSCGAWLGGGTPSKSNKKFWTNGIIPWLSPKDMGPSVIVETQDRITDEAVKSSSTSLVAPNSVAVVVRSGILERRLPVALVPFVTTLNQDMKALEVRGDLLPKWVLYALQAFNNEILSDCRKAGTTVASIEFPRLRDFEIPVAPLSEQKEIVRILEEQFSRLDAAAASIAAVRRKADQFRRALLRTAFDGSLNICSKDDSGIESMSRWSTESLRQVSSGGLFVDGDWVESKDQDPSGQIRLTQLADVGVGVFRDKSDRWLRADQASRLGVTFLEEGDLLIARMPDPLGRSCLVPKLPSAAVTVVDVAVLRIARADVDGRFVMWALNSPRVRDAMTMVASGTTRLRISRKKLESIEIPVPALEEQIMVVDTLEQQFSRLERSLAVADETERKVSALRRSLLHAAFSGELTKEWREKNNG